MGVAARASCIVSQPQSQSQSQSDVDRCTGPPCTAAAANPYLRIVLLCSTTPRWLLSGRFFEKDFIILPFPLTASLAFLLRETFWGRMIPLFYFRFFVASGGGRGPSWPPCRAWPEKTPECSTGDVVAREAGRQISRNPPCRISALPDADAWSWPRCHPRRRGRLTIRGLSSTHQTLSILMSTPPAKNTKTK